MRKLSIAIFTIIMLILLVACEFQNKSIAKIETAEFTEEEANILKLMGVDIHSRIFNYTVDERVKSIHINCYKLDENNKWQEEASSASQVNDLKGRIAISKMENKKLRIAYQSKNSLSAWVSNSDIYGIAEGKTSAISWLDTSEIIYGKEIPLTIQIFTSSSEIITYGVESFYDTERLKGHDAVMAITATFSEVGLD